MKQVSCEGEGYLAGGFFMWNETPGGGYDHSVFGFSAGDVLIKGLESMEQMALFARDNAAVSEEVAASSEQQLIGIEEISTSAQALTELAQELQLGIAKFKY